MAIEIKDDTYKKKFNDQYFETNRIMKLTSIYPTFDNIKIAWGNVNALLNSLVHTHYDELEKDDKTGIGDKMNDIEKILYGDSNSNEIILLRNKYGVEVKDDRRKRTMLVNAQKIMVELWKTFNAVKKWAREQELFPEEPTEEGEDGITEYDET